MPMKEDIDRLFCEIDDFVQQHPEPLKQNMIGDATLKRKRKTEMTLSEIMTIVIAFHQEQFRTFKHFYLCINQLYPGCFPRLVKYNRFVELMPRAMLMLLAYLASLKGQRTGINFADSTPIQVCKPKRMARNKVFKGIAKKGKSTIGWFFGFKLHLVTNEKGELLSFMLTPGNVDDRTALPELTKDLWGKLFGDKGYISQKLFEDLFARGLQLFTGIRKNMKAKLLPLFDRLLHRKRSIIETINDQLKNISQIEHSRHRSVKNFAVNLISGLIAYCLQPKKPSIKNDFFLALPSLS